MLRGCLCRARWAGPGPEQMIKNSVSCQRASSRISSSEPPTADKRSQRRRRSGCSWACEGANSDLWTAADVTALLSLLLSRRVQDRLTSSLIGRASSFDQDRYTGA